jgi:DNA-binding response OmpR family regulator
MTKKIVWIEDDVEIIRPVIRPLERAKYSIVTFQTAKDVFDNLEQLHEADVIILDIFIPHGGVDVELSRYTGVDIFEILKLEHQLTTPVIVLTVVAREEVRTRLRDLGVADIVRKPVRPSELKERIELILEETE